MNELEARAHAFATDAHGDIDQRRKYTGEPYIVHPIAVAELVRSVPHTPEMIAAALLHDVVEDTPVTIEGIETEFGARVAELVGWLTDVSGLATATGACASISTCCIRRRHPPTPRPSSSRT